MWTLDNLSTSKNDLILKINTINKNYFTIIFVDFDNFGGNSHHFNPPQKNHKKLTYGLLCTDFITNF